MRSLAWTLIFVRGELVVLLCPSGSGRPTLLNNLGGLDVPTAGELRYRDFDLTVANETDLTRYRRESVGFVLHFYNLIPSLTAREDIERLVGESAEDTNAVLPPFPRGATVHREE